MESVRANRYSPSASGNSRAGITSRKTSTKLGVRKERLAAAEAFLWQGRVEEAKALFADCQRKTTPATLKLTSSSIAAGLSIMRITKPNSFVLLVQGRLSRQSNRLDDACKSLVPDGILPLSIR